MTTSRKTERIERIAALMLEQHPERREFTFKQAIPAWRQLYARRKNDTGFPLPQLQSACELAELQARNLAVFGSVERPESLSDYDDADVQ